MQNKFNEEDKKKTIEFLNFIWQKTKLNNPTPEEAAKFVKLIGHMQTRIVPLINDHVLEVLAVHEPNTKEEAK